MDSVSPPLLAQRARFPSNSRLLPPLQNPFDDPTISSAMHSTRHEYDEESSISSTPKAGNSAYSLPAQTQAAPGRPDEMAQRIDDLHRREQELAAREAQLNAKAEHIRKHGRVRLELRCCWDTTGADWRFGAQNNWPPGPFPLIFHDIEMEVRLLPASGVPGQL